jgi:hypothetical protein
MTLSRPVASDLGVIDGRWEGCCHAAYRFYAAFVSEYNLIGLRLARVPPAPAGK